MDSRNDKISKFIIGDDKFAVSLFWTNFQCIERVLNCRLVGTTGGRLQQSSAVVFPLGF